MFELKGTEELAMDYDVFGKFVKSTQMENGSPAFLEQKTEGSRPRIPLLGSRWKANMVVLRRVRRRMLLIPPHPTTSPSWKGW